jgi:hypothetical protein
MSWFETLFGTEEPKGPRQVYEMLSLVEKEGTFQLISRANERSVQAGALDLDSLESVRVRFDQINPMAQTQVEECIADVQSLHLDSQNAGALFQVASQVNLLEMASPSATPADGVTLYQFDRTQGPACAIAAGGGTVYRNYFHVHSDGCRGQLEHQINTLSDLHDALLALESTDPQTTLSTDLWSTHNGYVLPSEGQLKRIQALFEEMSVNERDRLMGRCKIGLHWETEVTLQSAGHLVNQAYCSALPIGYSRSPATLWEPLARLVLDAAYEQVLKSAAIHHAEGGSAKVYLTKIGGGVFMNPEGWIYESIKRALTMVRHSGLEVKMVSYGRSQRLTGELVSWWSTMK